MKKMAIKKWSFWRIQWAIQWPIIFITILWTRFAEFFPCTYFFIYTLGLERQISGGAHFIGRRMGRFNTNCEIICIRCLYNYKKFMTIIQPNGLPSTFIKFKSPVRIRPESSIFFSSLFVIFIHSVFYFQTKQYITNKKLSPNHQFYPTF